MSTFELTGGDLAIIGDGLAALWNGSDAAGRSAITEMCVRTGLGISTDEPNGDEDGA